MAEIIVQKTGLSPKYVKDIVLLLDQGEERLIEKRMEHGPASTAQAATAPATMAPTY